MYKTGEIKNITNAQKFVSEIKALMRKHTMTPMRVQLGNLAGLQAEYQALIDEWYSRGFLGKPIRARLEILRMDSKTRHDIPVQTDLELFLDDENGQPLSRIEVLE